MKYATKLAEQLHLSIRKQTLEKEVDELDVKINRLEVRRYSKSVQLLSVINRSKDLEKEIQEENQQEY